MKRRGSVVTSASGAGVSSAAVGPAIAVLEAGSVAISRVSRTRVEHRSDEIREQHADQHGERVEEEEPLHQRQIVPFERKHEQTAKARAMQRAWISYRDTTCGFYGDKIRGSMAGFMEAACVARETARRAMLLKFFTRL